MTFKTDALQRHVSWQCYGCGKCNEKGLLAETVKVADGYLCEWDTVEDHVAHPGKYHHGVITTICFCHGAWAATAERYAAENKALADPLEYFYVNQRIVYDILKPIKLSATASILAKVTLDAPESAQVDFEISVDGDLCATATTRLKKVYATEMAF